MTAVSAVPTRGSDYTSLILTVRAAGLFDRRLVSYAIRAVLTIGAYGWYAGLRLFTWLTNHLLVRGVTHVVPHAFSPAPFPDLDCPPHFYAHGRNPQYRYHHLLSAYTNRLSHLLQGGVHVAPFAVLYHADAEWLGAAMPSERPMRLLMEAQLDADILPADSLPTSRLSCCDSMTPGYLSSSSETSPKSWVRSGRLCANGSAG